MEISNDKLMQLGPCEMGKQTALAPFIFLQGKSNFSATVH